MKRVMMLAMIGLFVLGWCVTGKALIEKPLTYNRLVREAEHYEEQKIYVRAIDSYKEALTYKPGTVDIRLRIAQDYLALGDESSFINQCNTINQEAGYPESVVTALADYYMEYKRYDSAIQLLQSAMKKHKHSEAFQTRFDALKYTYKKIYVTYDEILPFRNDSAVVKEEDKYGLIDISGNPLIRANREWTSVLSSDRECLPISQDGEFFFANEDGYRMEVPQDNQKVEEIGILINDVACAKINGKYGYINRKFDELSSFEWDKASALYGVGAVCKNDKWALIAEDFQFVTDYLFEDVKMDAYGICSISKRVFAKDAAGYHMFDEKGQMIGNDTYEDAVPFFGEEPTAVKKNGKWGFVDADGNMVIEPQYESAEAFHDGLAPVQTLNGWGYINSSNELVIKDEFFGAHSFYKGVAPVKAGNQWTLIELNVKQK